MTSSLVLLAGTYGRTDLQALPLKAKDGTFLCEKILANAPTNNIVIMSPREMLGVWTNYVAEAQTRLNKPISVFAEPVGKPSAPHLVSYYVSSHIPSIFLNLEYDSILFTDIFSYFENFDFMPELMEKESAVVISKVPDELATSVDMVRVDWKGAIQGVIKQGTLTTPKPMLQKDLALTGMFKTTTNSLLKTGIFRGGSFADTITALISRGIQIETVKHSGLFIPCGSALGLAYAQNLQIVASP